MGPGAVNFATNPHPLPGAEQSISFSAMASQVSLIGSALVLLVCAYAISRFGRTQLYVGGACLMLLALAILTQLRMTNSLNNGTIVALVSIISIVLAICSLQPGLKDLGVIGWAGVVVAVYSVFAFVINPYNAQFFISGRYSVAADKAIIDGIVLAGPMSHSNTLGTFLLLSLPFIALWSRRDCRIFGFSTVLIAIPLTASRTALIALGVICVFVAMRAAFTSFRGRFAGAVSMIAVGVAVVALPFLVTDRQAFSSRAATWQEALSVWRDGGSLAFGLGPYWRTGSDTFMTGYSPRTSSGHNLFTHWGVTGGFVMVIVGACVLAAVGRRALMADRGRVFPPFTMYVLALLTISITEFALDFTVSSQLFLVTGFAMTALLVAGDSDGFGVRRGTQAQTARRTRTLDGRRTAFELKNPAVS
ncbi:O-antigen ligase family protein [Mycolicibacterium sp. A43C]